MSFIKISHDFVIKTFESNFFYIEWVSHQCFDYKIMTNFDESNGQLVRVAFEKSYFLQNPHFNKWHKPTFPPLQIHLKNKTVDMSMNWKVLKLIFNVNLVPHPIPPDRSLRSDLMQQKVTHHFNGWRGAGANAENLTLRVPLQPHPIPRVLPATWFDATRSYSSPMHSSRRSLKFTEDLSQRVA